MFYVRNKSARLMFLHVPVMPTVEEPATADQIRANFEGMIPWVRVGQLEVSIQTPDGARALLSVEMLEQFGKAANAETTAPPPPATQEIPAKTLAKFKSKPVKPADPDPEV